MRHRWRRGLTLIETLVVLVIAALLIAVLLTVLFPSNDRRCRLEAERLAAFMMAASAESVMRDAPVRVVVDIEAGTIRREVTRVGAAITEELWEADDKAEVFEVSSPTRIDAVDSAASNDLRSGTGYVVFRGEQTEGAVVVLGVEEVLYSVVVPASGGEVDVVSGRAARPGGRPGIERGFAGFDLPPDTGEVGNLAEGSLGGIAPGIGTGFNPNNVGNRGTRQPVDKTKSPTENDTPNTDEPTGGGETTPPPTPAPPVPPKPPIEQPPVDPPVEPPPVVEPPGGGFGVACVDDDENACGGRFGWGKCEASQCVPNAIGRALRWRTLTNLAPQLTGITPVVAELIRTQIGFEQLNLIAYFDVDRNWIVQGRRDGEQAINNNPSDNLKRYRQRLDFPTYAGAMNDGNSLECDYADNSCTATVHIPQPVDLYIPYDGGDGSGQCGYQVLTVRLTMSLDFTISDNLLEVDEGTVELRAAVTRSAASKFRVEQETLDTLMMQQMPIYEPSDYVVDTNGDEQPDAWLFVFTGPVEGVWFPDQPMEDAAASPINCF